MRKLMQMVVLAALSLGALALPVSATDYAIDPEKSELVVRLFRGGFAAALGHNHVIRAADFSGKASFDPEHLSTASISVEAKADSLQADEPALREKYQLAEVVRDKDRRKIQATMESAEQMDVKKFPTIKFETTKVEKESEGKYTVSGDLTMHGVTQPVSFVATLSSESGHLRGRASFRFKQSDFGIRPYSALLGAVRNEDESVFYLDIVAVARPENDLKD
ncbi:MAG: YceI family protein [Candidatus Lindowbacteria bacterium]|nr:YceI family protein [Candidatus Lindowbacteria bacterium]